MVERLSRRAGKKTTNRANWTNLMSRWICAAESMRDWEYVDRLQSNAASKTTCAFVEKESRPDLFHLGLFSDNSSTVQCRCDQYSVKEAAKHYPLVDGRRPQEHDVIKIVSIVCKF